ncbi:hypothetical protein [Thermococcus sp.]
MRKKLIKSKIEKILESLKLVEENLPKGFKTFQSLSLIRDGISKRVEFAIQNIVDICVILRMTSTSSWSLLKSFWRVKDEGFSVSSR